MSRYASKIPPQVLGSLANMTEADRKIRASELLASYQARSMKLHKLAGRMAQDWVEQQSKFLQRVSDELVEIIATGDLPERL